jgi:hypothetical protein
MEARFYRAALAAALLPCLLGASYRTPNFVVRNGDPQFAKQMGDAAEKYRRELAIEWTGKRMPDWSQPCVMTVEDGPKLGAGGATTFIFDRGEVFGWRMTIQGPRDRLLDSVLPHEVTHMVFASHFRRPLPRWADEGGASVVEHPSEKAKHRKMLVEFLRTKRGIAFNRMFAMTEYPRDVMPLYAQGYALAEFLIRHGGKRKYIAFLEEGLQTKQWSAAIARHYGIRDLGELQNTWVAWIKQGMPLTPQQPTQLASTPQANVLAVNEKRPRPQPNLIYHAGHTGRPAYSAAAGEEMLPVAGQAAAMPEPPKSLPDAASRPVETQAAHPQPMEPARPIILQWGQ